MSSKSGVSSGDDLNVRQMTHCDLALTCIQQLLHRHQAIPPDLQAQIQNHLGVLTGLEHKLRHHLIQIAAFGWVSRGKSTVLNALLAEPRFAVSPLHGETRWPRSLRWTLPLGPASENAQAKAPLQVEVIDTPGLDEVADQGRAQMAQEIVATADLILFIVAGVPTPQELETLKTVHLAGRPLLLVVNKADLYPDLTASTLYAGLEDPLLRQMLSPLDILLTAAAPAPVQVRHEWPDGRISEEWEQPPPMIEALKDRLLGLLEQEGHTLLALNTLLQAQGTERAIAQCTVEHLAQPAEERIWRLVGIKALIMLSPWAILEVLIGTLCDLLVIGALVKLYGLPATRHRVNTLWQRLFLSLGGILAAEVGSGWLDLGSVWTAAGGMGQGAIAAYGAYRVGQATQGYLLQGCTWGPLGPSTLIQQILHQLEPGTLCDRLKSEWTDLVSEPVRTE